MAFQELHYWFQNQPPHDLPKDFPRAAAWHKNVLHLSTNMRNSRHAVRPDNRMDSQLFVRPVALVGAGSAMLHHRFISRANDVMPENYHVKDLLYRVRKQRTPVVEALSYLWSNPVTEERNECFASFLASDGMPKKIKAEIVGFLNSKPATRQIVSNADQKPTFIYLMSHARNGCFKIGISRTPKARESTLQAEDPELSMIGFWQATVGTEREAHALFASKRVRGEWFRLDASDLEQFRAFVTAACVKAQPPALPEANKKALRSSKALLDSLVQNMYAANRNETL